MWRRGQDGYVDGVEAGEEASLQVGFNTGFREGAARTRAVGRLKGIVRYISCNSFKPPESFRSPRYNLMGFIPTKITGMCF